MSDTPAPVYVGPVNSLPAPPRILPPDWGTVVGHVSDESVRVSPVWGVDSGVDGIAYVHVHGHRRRTPRGWTLDGGPFTRDDTDWVASPAVVAFTPAAPSSGSRWFTHTTTPPRPGILTDTPGATDAARILTAGSALMARHAATPSRVSADECRYPDRHIHDGWECRSCRPLAHHCATCRDDYGDPVPFPCSDYDTACDLMGVDW